MCVNWWCCQQTLHLPRKSCGMKEATCIKADWFSRNAGSSFVEPIVLGCYVVFCSPLKYGISHAKSSGDPLTHCTYMGSQDVQNVTATLNNRVYFVSVVWYLFIARVKIIRVYNTYNRAKHRKQEYIPVWYKNRIVIKRGDLVTSRPYDHWSNALLRWFHYSDFIMSAMASQITGLSIVKSPVCSGADQRKHKSSASLAFVRGIHRWLVNSPHKGSVTRKMFPFDDVTMVLSILGLVRPRRIYSSANIGPSKSILCCGA